MALNMVTSTQINGFIVDNNGILIGYNGSMNNIIIPKIVLNSIKHVVQSESLSNSIPSQNRHINN